MQLTIQLPPDVDSALRRRAEAAGQDVETFVTKIVTEEVCDQGQPPATHFDARSPEEFAAKLDEIIARHGTRVGHFDDSRESIYAGRGE